MAASQRSSAVEVRNRAEANPHAVKVDEGPSNLFVHFDDSVSAAGGVSRMSVAELHQFVGMAVATADLSLRRVEEHADGWMVVLKKN